MKKLFKYFESLWINGNGKPSLKSVLAIIFSINFIRDVSYAVHRWDGQKSLSDLALILGIEGGLILSLLGLKAYTTIQQSMLNNKNGKDPDNQGS